MLVHNRIYWFSLLKSLILNLTGLAASVPDLSLSFLIFKNIHSYLHLWPHLE